MARASVRRPVTDRRSASAGSGLKCKTLPGTVLHFRDPHRICGYISDMSTIANFLTWLMNQVGYSVCHQIPERSLRFGGRHLPVCSRDTGTFIAFALVFVALLVVYRKRPVRYPSWPKVLVLCALLLPLIVDAATSYGGLRESNNVIRIITGSLAGAAAAALLFPLFSDAVFTRGERLFEPDEPRVLPSWLSFVSILAAPVFVCLATWPRPAWAYWFWAPVVTLSLLLAVFALNLTLVALVLDRLAPYRAPAWVFAIVASVLSVAELALANGLHRIADHMLR